MQDNFINNSLNSIGKNNPKFRLSLKKLKIHIVVKPPAKLTSKLRLIIIKKIPSYLTPGISLM